VDGYDYHQADQPYLLEVWIEKSTMDDILLPVCRSSGMNLVTGVGYLSVTRVVEMLRRVAAHRKPTRIFYISDHDPSGEGMPIQAARQAEFWLRQYDADMGIKLTPIALDAEQAASYDLPRAPIKDSNLGRAGFEERHGAGAVELDALEALHPGELARLLREAASPYVDGSLPSRLIRASEEAEADALATWKQETQAERATLRAIDIRASAIARGYVAELRALSERMEAEIAPLQEQLEELRLAVARRAESLEIALPDRPEPDTDPTDENDWLFDSERNYFEQLDHYKARRGGAA
jgi:hypothetical protein